MVVADPTSPQAPAGHALLICLPSSQEALQKQMNALGFGIANVDNPYAALVELLDRPLVYRSLVISLAAIYREELSVIKTIRVRLPHVDVLLAHTDGRAASMAEAMRMGATGILDAEAVHLLPETAPLKTEISTPATAIEPPPTVTSSTNPEHGADEEPNDFDPLLTAEELRALLQEQPTLPGHG